eukprot:10399-Hanusia_phi.AAC.5
MLYVRDFCDYLFHRACPRRSAEQEDLSCYFQPLFSGPGIFLVEFASAQLHLCSKQEARCKFLPGPQRLFLPSSLLLEVSDLLPFISVSSFPLYFLPSPKTSLILSFSTNCAQLLSSILEHVDRLLSVVISQLFFLFSALPGMPDARQGLLRAVKSSLSFRNPIIGVHVRRGDSCKLKASPG